MTIQINGTSGISGVDGSAGTPAFQGTDSNTGIHFPAADTVAIDTGGSERVRVDSSGRVGVGTTSFSGNEKLNVSSSTGSTALSIKCASGSLYTGSLLFGAENFGNFGGLEFDDQNAWFRLYAAGNRPLLFSTNSTERMRITNDGRVGINTTNYVNGRFIVGSDCSVVTTAVFDDFLTGSSSSNIIGIRRNGTFVGNISTTNTSTAYNTSSDYRLKENVVPLTGAVDRVNQLQVHRFNFISDPDKTVDGFLAHEAQEVVPECVTGTKDEVDADGNPVYQGIDQSKLVPLLTAALQEALAEIKSLKARVTALEP